MSTAEKQQEINYTDTLAKYYNHDIGKYFTGKYTDVVELLHKKILQIQETFKGEFLFDPGEMLLVLNYQFGTTTWRSIKYGVIDDMIFWIKGNRDNFRTIVDSINKKMSDYYAKHSETSTTKA